MDIAISPVSLKVFAWFFGLLIAIPLVFLLPLKFALKFPWSTIFIVTVIGVAAGVLISIFALRNSVSSTRDEVVIKAGGMYSLSVSPDSLKPPAARIVDLEADREFRPRLRTNGIGLFGYQAGWFRLGNGEKAFVLLTQRRKVLYSPSTDERDHAILLSVESISAD